MPDLRVTVTRAFISALLMIPVDSGKWGGGNRGCVQGLKIGM